MEKNEHFPREQDKLYERIYGGISWPGARPGFIVIVGQLKIPNENGHKYILLNEHEDFDTESLIAKAGALDCFYNKLDKWLSGELDKATTKLLLEFNKQPDYRPGSRRLRIISSRIKGLQDEIFKYVYPKLKRMAGENGELDISKAKMMLNYMSLPQDSEISAIQHGDYPSIEALAFAVFELDQARDSSPRATHAKCDYQRL